ncbi:MAG TPA: PilZ domain-containing protein [Thermodesulfovibrionales bacterium]|nr:PilZ domain-containing protein [Thermodesulfovibrionales bacterium]
MLNRRQCKRFPEHCNTEFTCDGMTYNAISGDFALNGLFIFTDSPRAPGTYLTITIRLPDGSSTRLIGRVMRLIKTFRRDDVGNSVQEMGDGMGVEIMERDINYLHFIRSLLAVSEEHEGDH